MEKTFNQTADVTNDIVTIQALPPQDETSVAVANLASIMERVKTPETNTTLDKVLFMILQCSVLTTILKFKPNV